MAKEVFYKQCELSKKMSDGIARQVSWLPVRFAVVGKYVKLHDDDGWLVENASEPPLPEHVVAQKTTFPSIEKGKR